MQRGIDPETNLDAMCRRLAEVGVPLFERTAVGPALGGDEYAQLIVDLFRSGEPRLRLAILCLLAAHDGAPAATATAHAAAMLTAAEADELGLLYRLGRSLLVSRAPYLGFLYGRRPTLPALPIEPVDVPDPSESHGERTLWFVSETCRERLIPDLAGGAAHQFDTWLDLVRKESGRSKSDRFRAMLELALRSAK